MISDDEEPRVNQLLRAGAFVRDSQKRLDVIEGRALLDNSDSLANA